MNIQGLKWLCCSCHAPSNAKRFAEQVNEELKKTLPTLVKKTLSEFEGQQMKQSFAEIIKQQENVHERSTSRIVSTMSNLSQKLDQTSSLIDSSVNIEEAADRKKRLNNLILFNLPESAADLPEDQMKEDCLKFKELISNKIMLEPDAVLNIYRLGRKKDDTLRPLLVKLRSEKLKWDIIKSSKNLKYFRLLIVNQIA